MNQFYRSFALVRGHGYCNLIPLNNSSQTIPLPMLIQATLPQVHQPWFPSLLIPNKPTIPTTAPMSLPLRRKSLRMDARGVLRCSARRRLRYDDEDEEEEDYRHNSEIAMLESYSESARSEALLVRAIVGGEEEVVLIFKGFSSCLSSRTAIDPSKSVLPAKAVIKSIDVIKGPFDPSNIEYLEKDLTWEAFKTRLQLNKY